VFISLLVDLQINQVTLQLRVSLSDLDEKLLAYSPAGPEIFFYRDPNPLSAALSEAIS
jgi:hypothetical protein